MIHILFFAIFWTPRRPSGVLWMKYKDLLLRKAIPLTSSSGNTFSTQQPGRVQIPPSSNIATRLWNSTELFTDNILNSQAYVGMHYNCEDHAQQQARVQNAPRSKHHDNQTSAICKILSPTAYSTSKHCTQAELQIRSSRSRSGQTSITPAQTQRASLQPPTQATQKQETNMTSLGRKQGIAILFLSNSLDYCNLCIAKVLLVYPPAHRKPYPAYSFMAKEGSRMRVS